MSQMDGGGKEDSKGSLEAAKRLPVSFFQVLVGFGNMKKCGVKEGHETQHWIKPWPAAPPAKPPLLAMQIPGFNELKPEFQK